MLWPYFVTYRVRKFSILSRIVNVLPRGETFACMPFVFTSSFVLFFLSLDIRYDDHHV